MNELIQPKVYIKSLQLTLPAQRINYDVKTVEVDLDENGEFVEYGFGEIEFLPCEDKPINSPELEKELEFLVHYLYDNCGSESWHRTDIISEIRKNCPICYDRVAKLILNEIEIRGYI